MESSRPHRIAQNRLKIALMILFTVLALVPLVLGMAYIGAALLARLAGHPFTDYAFALRLMPITGGVSTTLLMLLLWAADSSPATNMLAELDALPAAASEPVVQALDALAAQAGIPRPKLYVIPSDAPNLLCGGTDPRHAFVAVTRGALRLLDEKELQAVLAHGLSHIANHDIRVSSVVATLSASLRMPYRVLRDQLSSEVRSFAGLRWKLMLFGLTLSPLGLYVFFVGPLLGFVVRAVSSRQLEIVADRDAAALTGDPQGVLTALAKIGGANGAVEGENPALRQCCFTNPDAFAWLSGDFRAAPPRLTKRIETLAQSGGAVDMGRLQEAIEKGKAYGRRYPGMNEVVSPLADAGDAFGALRRGSAMGRVCRVAADEPVQVYETDKPRSLLVGSLHPDELVVVFEGTGPMREINTAAETFGYISRKVRLEAVNGVVPQEIYDPQLRAAVERDLPPCKAAAAAPGLSRKQVWIVLAFGVAVFTVGTILMVLLSIR